LLYFPVTSDGSGQLYVATEGLSEKRVREIVREEIAKLPVKFEVPDVPE
jgi:hypothetical protein